MTITIQVVGVFFKIDLPLDGATQVLNVMKAAKNVVATGKYNGIGSFDFALTTAPNQQATSFTVEYTLPVIGRGIGRKYPPGVYFLPEDLNLSPAYTVWQYYLSDDTGKPISQGIKFLDDPTAVVPAGGKLTWRLVSILKQPNSPPPAMVARSA